MEEEIRIQERAHNNLLSPEGVTMLFLAVFFDISEIITDSLLPVAGEALSFFIDILAMIIIGGWLWFRKGYSGVRLSPRIRRKLKTIRKFRWLGIGLELLPIPFIGDLPYWTLIVYTELKYS